MLRDNSMMKKLVETGEERIGKLTQQVLANEKFITAVQTVVSKSLAAKGSLDKSLRTALSAMNLPSVSDVEGLRTKVDDLERLLSSVEGKLETLLADRKH